MANRTRKRVTWDERIRFLLISGLIEGLALFFQYGYWMSAATLTTAFPLNYFFDVTNFVANVIPLFGYAAPILLYWRVADYWLDPLTRWSSELDRPWSTIVRWGGYVGTFLVSWFILLPLCDAGYQFIFNSGYFNNVEGSLLLTLIGQPTLLSFTRWVRRTSHHLFGRLFVKRGYHARRNKTTP